MNRILAALLFCCGLMEFAACAEEPVTLNRRDDGYRGIWYMNQPSNDEYVYKYSGGLGTYCAKHRPFAVYCAPVNKTFFCYGGATKDDDRKLLHMVSYFDHATGTVPRPTVLLDKRTNDAHDNPVISVDFGGYLWIFSTSHGTGRPSYIHRSKRPYDIAEFELVPATRADGNSRVPITNFSYMQAWHVAGQGFLCFFTRYGYPAARTSCFMSSPDGEHWSAWQRLAAIEEGHYQVSAVGKAIAGTMFNYHPRGKGLNWRTNLYYLQTKDSGRTWQTVTGEPVTVPVTEVANPALVRDYASEGLNVYLKDVAYDEQDRPILLYITSRGYESGPKNDPRTWTLARWTGSEWKYHSITTSDNNYDMGELWLRAPDDWRLTAPTENGPQAYNPGGEIAMWTSRDQGASWTLTRQLTSGSATNHTYVRRPLNTHPGFVALWADGHGRQPSESRLYFSDEKGSVFVLPREMKGETATPEFVSPRPVKSPRELAFRHPSFTFVRIQHSDQARPGRRGMWATDYPDSDVNLTARVAVDTGLATEPNGKVLRLTDDPLKRYPFIYLVEAGSLALTEEEVVKLREYLLGGGFLMVDDFWGVNEWENFRVQIKRVFPDREPRELPLEHELFHCFYVLREKPQVPSIHAWLNGLTSERRDAQQANYYGISDDKGRMMMVICHNTDLGDGWERADVDVNYNREICQRVAYPMGVNIVVYALTRR
jgi:hypothetical protein